MTYTQKQLDEFRRKQIYEIENEIRMITNIAKKYFHDNINHLPSCKRILEDTYNDVRELYRIKESIKRRSQLTTIAEHSPFMYTQTSYADDLELLLQYIDFNNEITENGKNWEENFNRLIIIHDKIRDIIEAISKVDPNNSDEKELDELFENLNKQEELASEPLRNLKNLQIKAKKFSFERSLRESLDNIISSPLKTIIKIKLPTLTYTESAKNFLKSRFIFLKNWEKFEKNIASMNREIELLLTEESTLTVTELKNKKEKLEINFKELKQEIEKRNALLKELPELQSQDPQVRKIFGSLIFDLKKINQNKNPELSEKDILEKRVNFLKNRIFIARKNIKENLQLYNASQANPENLETIIGVLINIKEKMTELTQIESIIIKELQSLRSDIPLPTNTPPENFIKTLNQRINILKKLHQIDKVLNLQTPLYQKIMNNLYQMIQQNPMIPTAIISLLVDLDSRKSDYNIKNALLSSMIKFAIGKISPDFGFAFTYDTLREAKNTLLTKFSSIPIDRTHKNNDRLLSRLAQAFLIYQISKNHGKITKFFIKLSEVISRPWVELSQLVFNIYNHHNKWSSYIQLTTMLSGLVISATFLTTILPLNFPGAMFFFLGIDLTARTSHLVAKSIFNNALLESYEPPLSIQKVLGTVRAQSLWNLLRNTQKDLGLNEENPTINLDKIQQLKNIQFRLANTSDKERDLILKLEKEFIILYYQDMRKSIIETEHLCTSSRDDLLEPLTKYEQIVDNIREHLSPIPPLSP